DRGFLNRVNSVRVESGAFVCFDHPDFKGQQYILEHGEYPDFQRWNAHNDHMGSCRPIRMVGLCLCLKETPGPGKYSAELELFEGDNFAGQCVELCGDCPFLQARGLTKNCVNSIKVYGDGAYVSLSLSSMRIQYDHEFYHFPISYDVMNLYIIVSLSILCSRH
ncbi:hypothetical protein XENOCAPTIV_029614, partial [Xenoophorus captivus]